MLGLFALAVSFSGSAPAGARRPPGADPARARRARREPVAAEPEVPLAGACSRRAPYCPRATDTGYGGYIYQNTPVLGDFALLFAPAVNAFESIPFSGLALFIGLSIFSRSANLSRFVRFNIQQASCWISRW